MKSVLLLNSSYEPLRVISLQRAIGLVLAKRVDVVESDDQEVVRSPSTALPLPRVVRLIAFVKIPYRARVALNRKSLMARDRGTCQYCGKAGNTIDHVQPRSRGGLHRWENVVIACGPCNQRKGDKLLGEIGWKLLNQPIVPRVGSHILIGVARIDPSWEAHLALA